MAVFGWGRSKVLRQRVDEFLRLVVHGSALVLHGAQFTHAPQKDGLVLIFCVHTALPLGSVSVYSMVIDARPEPHPMIARSAVLPPLKSTSLAVSDQVPCGCVALVLNVVTPLKRLLY